MIDVFPAINDVYRSHPALRGEGRPLVEGDVSREHPPYTLLASTLIDDLSTFGQAGPGLDVERWSLTFELFSKTFLPGAARRWIEGMRDAFDDADIIDPIFETVGSRVVPGGSGPTNEDEQFRATVEVELTVQRDSIRPRVRH